MRKRWRVDSRENSCLKEPVPGEEGAGGGVGGETTETGSGFSIVSTLESVCISIDCGRLAGIMLVVVVVVVESRQSLEGLCVKRAYQGRKNERKS